MTRAAAVGVLLGTIAAHAVLAGIVPVLPAAWSASLVLAYFAGHFAGWTSQHHDPDPTTEGP